MARAHKRRLGLALAALTAIAFVPSALAAHTSSRDARPTNPKTVAARSTPLTQPKPRAGTLTLATDIPHGLTAKPIGAPAASAPLHIGVLLRGKDDAGLAQFERAQQTPGTSANRHPLTGAQFEDRFGVEPQREAAVLSWLRNAGLDIPGGKPARARYVLAAGTVGSVSKLLRIRFATYRAPDGSSFIANVDAPDVPSQFGIARVLGLNGSLKLKPLFARAFPASKSTNPADLWTLYNQPTGPKLNATDIPNDLGQGQQLATLLWGSKLELDQQLANDLTTFETQNKLPHITFALHVQNGYVDPGPSSDPAGAGLEEAELDSQASTAMAPAADKLTTYLASSSAIVDLAEVASEWANDPNGARQLSASFGGCESLDLALEGAGLDDAFRQARYGEIDTSQPDPTKERTVFVSTGDTGAGCIAAAPTNGFNSPLLETEYPASSPYVVAVGGTVVTEDNHASPMSEYAWNAGGGGISKYEAQPAWQQGVTPIAAPCIVDTGTLTWVADTPQGRWAVNDENPTDFPTNPPQPPPQPQVGGPCRATPDVAAQSGDLTSGFNIVSKGSTVVASGTSLSAPLWQGMWARVAAASPDEGATAFAAPLLYAHPAAFNDITFGDNGPYPATPGWDYASGLGSPNITQLITDIDGADATVPPLSTPLSSDAGTNNASGGGGGTTCAPGQNQITDPPGDATQIFGAVAAGPSQDDLDIRTGNLSWSPTTATLTATITVTNLNATPPGGLNDQEHFRYSFNYGTTAIELSADRSVSASSPATESFKVSTGGLTAPSAAATGSFDASTNTITIAATQAELTAAGVPAPLKSGTSLTAMSIVSQRNVGVSGKGATSTTDSANASCDYQLP